MRGPMRTCLFSVVTVEEFVQNRAVGVRAG